MTTFPLVAVVAVLTALSTNPAGSPEAGLDLSRWKGQVVLVDFWASWCVPCRQSFPWMAGMRETYRDRGLVVVAVNVDEDAGAAARFLKGAAAMKAPGGAGVAANAAGDFVHLSDPEGNLARAYGVSVMPSSLLFDRDGRPVYRHQGFHPEQKGEYERRIVELLEGRGPARSLAIEPAVPAGLGVHAWERSVLADPAMQLVSDPLEIELDDHIYFSKEASSGGRGFGGGGCGCN